MNHKILFVNNHSTTLLIEQVLFARHSDYCLIPARDGLDAIQKAVTERPSLILMDATAANIDASREMRKIEQLKRVPILLVSATEPAPAANNLGNCDPDAPLGWTQLFDMVDTYLTARAAHR
jgi:CheY-like chemotaxis protein